MSLDERRKRRDEIAGKMLTMIGQHFQVHGGMDLMIHRGPLGYYNLGPGWLTFAQTMVEEFIKQGIIDPEKSDCRCDLPTLMNRGCQCGEAFLEKAKKANG